MDNSQLMFGDAQRWVQDNKAQPLLAAIAVVVALGFFRPTRPFSTPIGVIIIALWFFKWKRTH